VTDVWNGSELQISFRRGVTENGMQNWHILTSIAESINYTEDCDSIIWDFDASSNFSVQSMYKTISFRGIQPVFTPVVWELNVPPRIHIFLWLLSNNKTLTRTNLAKRRNLDNQSCLDCSENETVHYLFFGCCVATALWNYIADIFGIPIGSNFESVARWWVSNKRNNVLNTCGAAFLWNIWKLRNEMCFQGKVWKDVKVVLNKMVRALESWTPICRAGSVEKMEWVLEQLKQKSRQPLQLTDNASEMGNVTLSSLALRPSELDPSPAASGATAEVVLQLSPDVTSPDSSISD